MWICWETSEDVELGPLCSKKMSKCLNVYDPVLTSLPKVSNSQELGHSADESCSESN